MCQWALGFGRWLQRDPLGYVDGMNMSEYVGGMPLNALDPMGLQQWKVSGGGGGGCINTFRGVGDRSPFESDNDEPVYSPVGPSAPEPIDVGPRSTQWDPLQDWLDERGGKAGAYYEQLEEGGEIITEAAILGAGVLTPIPGDEVAAAAVVVARLKKVVAAARVAQKHHLISAKVYKALQKHKNLRGKYKKRDGRFIAEASDYESHHGYQQWHRDLDDEIEAWLRRKRHATEEDFERYLRQRYNQPDLKGRFPNGF